MLNNPGPAEEFTFIVGGGNLAGIWTTANSWLVAANTSAS
jgi:hypothetical protein